MSEIQPTTGPVARLLDGAEILRAVREDGKMLYLVPRVLQVLTGTAHADNYWMDLKAREPALAALAEPAEFRERDGAVVSGEGLTLEGILRLIQAVPSAKAERIKQWLVESARLRIEESDDPELALLRARRLYEHRGYPRRWIEKRLRNVSARHELTGEWYRRGARESDDFRRLTNDLVRGAFGMDVEGYRRYKRLFGTRQNLRDHMTDLELSLVALAETTAAVLHRRRGSEGMEQLQADVSDAGQIVAATIEQIEQRGEMQVVSHRNHLDEPAKPVARKIPA